MAQAYIFPTFIYDENIPDHLGSIVQDEGDEIKEGSTKPGNKWLRWKNRYDKEGMRRTASAVLLAHEEGIPVVFLLRDRISGAYFLFVLFFFSLCIFRPGGHLKPGEFERDGLLRKLSKLVHPKGRNLVNPSIDVTKASHSCGCEVGEMLGRYWRPNYSDEQYPFLPLHVARPKEQETLHLVTLPQTGASLGRETYQGVPNYKHSVEFAKVSLAELSSPSARVTYGVVISSIPLLLSRLRLQYYVPKKMLHDTGVTLIEKAATDEVTA